MNLSTFKIRIKNDNVKEDNLLLAIHSPLEVFYLSVKDSALKDIPVDFRKDYFITESDFFDGEKFCSSEGIICTLDEVFSAKDFKDFCYKIHLFTSKGVEGSFYIINVLRDSEENPVVQDLDENNVVEQDLDENNLDEVEENE